MKPPKPFKPGPATIKALAILAEFPLIRAAGFAKAMWPDSHMHTKHSNGGHGCQKGKAAWLCGGSFLAKLERHGLVKLKYRLRGAEYQPDGYVLTDAGKAALYTVEFPELQAKETLPQPVTA